MPHIGRQVDKPGSKLKKKMRFLEQSASWDSYRCGGIGGYIVAPRGLRVWTSALGQHVSDESKRGLYNISRQQAGSLNEGHQALRFPRVKIYYTVVVPSFTYTRSRSSLSAENTPERVSG